jgi:hypothetical protein
LFSNKKSFNINLEIPEFDCILTNITLKKIQKEQWKLPEKEKLRIENILKRSIDVEKGSEKPSVTEEHPDGCMYNITLNS